MKYYVDFNKFTMKQVTSWEILSNVYPRRPSIGLSYWKSNKNNRMSVDQQNVSLSVQGCSNTHWSF
jgi:hypothetical protein